MPAASNRFGTIEQASTTARGYGSEHQKARREAAALHDPSDPCARCGHELGPMGPHLHYDHNGDRTGYLGFSHADCNRRAGAREGRSRQGDVTDTPRRTWQMSEPESRFCVVCGDEFVTDNPRHWTCGPPCAVERGRTTARNRYRESHGIPLDAPLDRRGRPRRNWYVV